MNSDDLCSGIQRAFSEREPEVARICLAIVEYLRSQKSLDKLHLTLSLLNRVTSAQSAGSLVAAMQYLTGAQAQLLDVGFEFVDESGDYHFLTIQDIDLARQTKQLVRPDTGELLRDFESRVLIYYKPSIIAQKILTVI